MAWTHLTAGTVSAGGNRTSASVTAPTRQVGDLLILVVSNFGGTGSRTPSADANWTPFDGDNGYWLNGTTHLGVWWRVATNTTADNATVTYTGTGVANDDQLCRIYAFRPDAGPPAVRVYGSESTNASADGIGPVTGIDDEPGDLRLLIVAKSNDWNGTATLSGWTLSAQSERTTGNDCGNALLYQLSGDGVATGNLTVTDNGATNSAGVGLGVLIAFRELVPIAVTAADGSAGGDAAGVALDFYTDHEVALAADEATSALGGAGNTYQSSSADGSAGADASTAAVRVPGAATDGSAGADSATALADLRNTVADGGSAADSSTNRYVVRPGTSEQSNIGDSATPSTAKTGAATDGATAADSATAAQTVRPTATDGATAADSASSFAGSLNQVAAADGARAADAATTRYLAAPTATDGVRIADPAGIALEFLTQWDGARVGDEATVASFNLVTGSSTEGAAAADEMEATVEWVIPDEGAVVADTADAFTSNPLKTGTGTEGALGADTATTSRRVPASDGSAGADAATQRTVQRPAATDGARGADAASALKLQPVTATDGVRIGEVTATQSGTTVNDTTADGCRAADAAIPIIRARPVALDGAAAADTGSTLTGWRVEAVDGELTADEALTELLAVATGSDGARASDTCSVRFPGAVPAIVRFRSGPKVTAAADSAPRITVTLLSP